MQPRRHTPNRKNAASQQQRQTPVQQLRAHRAGCRESFHCVWLFVHTSGQRSHARKYNNDRAEEKEWKNWTQSWKITAFCRGKWPMECETRDLYCMPTKVIFGEADPALYGVFCNSSNRWLLVLETFTAAALHTVMRLLLQQQARALTHNAAQRARKTFIMLFQFSQWDESQSRLAAVGAHLRLMAACAFQ
jgi:hypothetical protein